MIKLKALYTVKELAELSGVSPKTMRRILKTHGINPILAGTSWLIPLSEIEEKIFALRKSIQRVEIYRESVLDSTRNRS